MHRHRFSNGILAEFLPPKKKVKKCRLILLYDGLPSIPRKQPLAEFLAKKGFWVLYPRYRGAWESEGELLKISPEKDIEEIIDALPHGLTDVAFQTHFELSPEEIFVIGGSFGGCTALMASLNPKIKKVVANCPVVDWSILEEELPKETSNSSYAAYLKEAFGPGYRLSEKNWKKLEAGHFFNPTAYMNELDPKKVILFHAKDDPYIPWEGVKNFAEKTGIKLYSFAKGGHLDTVETIQKQWKRIEGFLK